ncbi:MAG: Vitamin B12 transporter BtuB [Saprospiraceae bacterium]|jgi:outer membrane receptor protein involved in Fe transport|nr:Vitamin B12 transporter BtuB [Saprospiraceae bacterium]
MVRIIFCLFIAIIHLSAYSQKNGSIAGKLLDSENKPVEFASVYLTTINDSTTIVSGTITDSSGSFNLTDLSLGEFIIHFQFIGFVKQKKSVLLSEENKNLQIGDIVLQPDATTLNSVEVIAIRNMIKKTEEGIVMNASDNLTQIGGTAADLLKNMPGVLVDADGAITLRGKTPLILINGRISGIGGADRVTNLEQIPASSIERIEIITNPSAKYDADAEGGIINIVLKQNADWGTNGSVALGGGFGERYRINGSVLLNHRTSKWNFGLAYDNWFTTRTRKQNGDRIQYNLPNEYFLTQRRSDERIVQTQTARFNIDYTPNKKNNLRLEGIWLFEGQDNRETVISTTETSAYDFTGRNSRYANEIRRFHTGELLFNYTRKFSNPNQILTFNASSSIEYNRENTDLSTQTLSEQNFAIGNPFLQKTHNYEDANLTNFSVDYVHPVNDKGMIETGYKGILRFIDVDFLRSNQFNGNFVTDSVSTDIFKFSEQIHAAYLQYTGWIGDKQEPKWKYSLGIRAEQVWNKGNTIWNPVSFSNDYFNLFPSASLIYYTPKRNMFKLSYSRRINRPSLGRYNPFTDITDSLNIYSGNPKLKPELAHSVDMTYNYSFKKGSVTTSAFFRQTSNVIMPYTVVDSNGVGFTQPQNFGNASTYGLEAIISYNPFKFWSINLNVSGYNLQIEDTDPTLNIQQNQFTGYAKLINNFSLWKNGKIQITGNYTSPVAIPQGEQKEVYFVDLGLQQKILKGQGRLALTVTDIFNTQQSGYRISDSNFSFVRTRKVDTRAVMLIFAYTFRSEFKEKLLENKFKNE